MKRILLSVMIVAGFSSAVLAQDPTSVFAYQQDSLPLERLYVQFDRQAYVVGETAWFKGYVLSVVPGGTVSTNFYIDLLDGSGKTIDTKKLPITTEGVTGSFEIPTSLKQGVYFVRAYTPWSLNFGQAYVFKKAIPIFNSSAAMSMQKPGTDYSFEIAPEGRQLVMGLPNNIAFRAVDQYQQPVMIKAKLENSKGVNAGDFATGKESSGSFSFTPPSMEKYVAVVTFPDQSTKRYELPVPVKEGATLTVANHELGKAFSALVSPALATAELQLIATINNLVVLNAPVQPENNEASGLIPSKDLQPGILHLYLFDKQKKLLAERTTLVQGEPLAQSIQVKADALNTAAKSWNSLSFTFPEGLKGNFSVSVTDADRELVAKNDDDIYATLLLQSGAEQYVRPPAFPVSEEDLDIIMMTNNWYGTDVSTLTKKKLAVNTMDHYLVLEGKVVDEQTGRPIGSDVLNITVQPKNFSPKNYTTPLMADGSFKLDNLLFMDSATIYYQVESLKRDKNKPAQKLVLEEGRKEMYSSNFRSFNVQPFLMRKQPVFENEATLKLAANLQQDVLTGMPATKTADVTTTDSKEKSAKKLTTDKRYAGGAFSSSSGRSVDLLKDPPNTTGTNAFDYLQGRISGLIINKNGGSYAITSTRSQSTQEVTRGNRNGMVAGKVFLNEIEVTSDQITSLPLNQFALVKYYEPGSISLPGLGISCVLAFWTKHTEDLNVIDASMQSIMYAGYPAVRPFPSPDYSSGKGATDKRVTLLWQPNVTIGDNNQVKIGFYNTDVTKRFHVVLEGVTAEGNPVHFEKILE